MTSPIAALSLWLVFMWWRVTGLTGETDCDCLSRCPVCQLSHQQKFSVRAAGSLQVTNRKVERVRMVKVNVLYRHSAIWIHRWNMLFFKVTLFCFKCNYVNRFYKSLHAATILYHYISIITIAVIKVKQ